MKRNLEAGATNDKADKSRVAFTLKGDSSKMDEITNFMKSGKELNSWGAKVRRYTLIGKCFTTWWWVGSNLVQCGIGNLVDRSRERKSYFRPYCNNFERGWLQLEGRCRVLHLRKHWPIHKVRVANACTIIKETNLYIIQSHRCRFK
jgi:hypothetical protein